MRTTTYKTAAILIAAGIALAHLLIAATVDLSVDEAHYGLYARFLDWSYFDHPPMVGWLLWLLSPLGLNEFTLRLPAAAFYLLCSYLIYHLSANKLAGGSAGKGLLALVLFSVTPMIQLLGFGLVPEFPLLLWALLIALLVNGLDHHSPLKTWLALGLLFGLAGLTKYTAVLLAVGVAGYWLRQGQLLCVLQQARLYLAIAVAAVVVSPVFIWNYLHDWASFNYQLNHAAGGEWEIGEAIKALAVQILVYSPVLLVGGIVALKDISRAGMGGILAWLAAPVLLLVLVTSGNGYSLPHWSLLGWSLLAPGASHWLLDNWQRPSIRRLTYIGNGFALTLSVLILVILAFKPLGALPWAAVALRDLSGWKQAATTAAELSEKLDPDSGIILVSNWSQASRIAWYTWPRTVQVLDNRPGQFVYWYGAPDQQTRGVLIRDNIDDDEDPTTPYSKMGLQCNYLQHHATTVDGVTVNHFYFYFCAAAPLHTGAPGASTSKPSSPR